MLKAGTIAAVVLLAIGASPATSGPPSPFLRVPAPRATLVQLVETMGGSAAAVDAARFRGTCYRAANWLHVGQTAGRGRMDREHKAHGRAVKDVYVYPLIRDARQRLCGDLTR